MLYCLMSTYSGTSYSIIVNLFSLPIATGVFSPIGSSSSTQSYLPPTMKSFSEPNPVINGHLPSAASQVPEGASIPSHTSATSREKTALSRKLSAAKQGLGGGKQTISSNAEGKGEISTLQYNSHAPENSPSLTAHDMMHSARHGGSREGMVFDDTFEGMTIYVSVNWVKFTCWLYWWFWANQKMFKLWYGGSFDMLIPAVIYINIYVYIYYIITFWRNKRLNSSYRCTY